MLMNWSSKKKEFSNCSLLGKHFYLGIPYTLFCYRFMCLLKISWPYQENSLVMEYKTFLSHFVLRLGVSNDSTVIVNNWVGIIIMDSQVHV